MEEKEALCYPVTDDGRGFCCADGKNGRGCHDDVRSVRGERGGGGRAWYGGRRVGEGPCPATARVS